MTQLTFVPATEAHCRAIELREADVLELRAAGWEDPLEALLDSLKASSVAISTLHGGRVVALGGVAMRGPMAVPWLLCADLDGIPAKTVIREARRWLSACRVLAGPRMLVNQVHKDHRAAHRFIEAVGGVLCPSVPNGDFVYFHLPHV